MCWFGSFHDNIAKQTKQKQDIVQYMWHVTINVKGIKREASFVYA